MATQPNSAQAIQFANQKIRPLDAQLYSLYLNCKSVLQQWNSQNVSLVIGNDTITINDGAATDGRPPMTGAQATNVITRAQDVVNWCEGSLPIAAGDGSKAVLNTISAIEVNGVGTL